MFGGFTGKDEVNDTYILDMETWVIIRFFITYVASRAFCTDSEAATTCTAHTNSTPTVSMWLSSIDYMYIAEFGTNHCNF